MKSWKNLLYQETRKDYYRAILERVHRERKSGDMIYPKQEDIFNAFRLTPLDKVQVVIIGQDPYHGPGQAHGLSFSVKKGIPIPPSLKNIFQEISTDLDVEFAPKSGDLSGWARQGVLLLNTYLTVMRGRPMSHSKSGWERFTDSVIVGIDKYLKEDCVFLLWGSKAQNKESLIKWGHVLKAGHPSPYSVSGFFGCKHFSKTNDYLLRRGRRGIEWTEL